MHVGVLGPLTVSTGTGTVSLGGARQRRLMAALTANLNQVVSLDRLVDIVFQGAPSERAATTLRSYVARLRRSLDDGSGSDAGAVNTEAHGYVLRLDEEQIDANRFLALVQRGRQLLAAREEVTAAGILQDALTLWRGPAYDEFADEDWIQPQAARLEEERLNAEEHMIEALLACGRTEEVIPRLRRLIAENPLRERPRGQLMLALHRAGRQAEALRAYREFHRTLGDVALEPSDDLVALDRSIAVQDPALLLPAAAGQSLRGYRLGEEIGRGAHGVVHRAIQPGIGRPVAIKTVRPELADDVAFIRRFDAEAQVVSQLEHPHVVPLYDFWREPGGAYLVMRVLPGDLSQRLGDGPMTVHAVSIMAAQLGSALSAAHRASVVHGDVKPSNVLLDDEGHAYLSDFGVSAFSDGTATTDSSGYESPEQISGERASPASDQFALAVLLSHALSGLRPFGRRGMASPNDRPAPVHLHRPAVPPAADDVLHRAMAWSADDRFDDVEQFVGALRTALGDDDPSTGEPLQRPSNPYKGLRPFVEADAPVFFGREQIVGELLGQLGGHDGSSRFATLVGASGSGKSSIVRAGLVPRLRLGAVTGSDDWLVATFVPGAEPFASLAGALRSISTADVAEVSVAPAEPGRHEVRRLLDAAVPRDQPLLLVIDQFEELFTAVEDETARRAFVDGIVDVATRDDSRVRIVATLRADFYDRPLRYHRLGDVIRDGATTIVGMSATELDEAVRGPAATVGVEVEPALAVELVADVVDEPAALPLLQFALTELFERRSGTTMTLASYRAMGGVDVALAGRADDVYDRLSAEDRATVRELFLRLVTFDREGTPTRRRAMRSELLAGGSDPSSLDQVLDRFGRARLLTFDRDRRSRAPTVEVSHEALIAHWPRLATWVDVAGDDLRLQLHLGEAARGWDERGRDDGELYRGGRLEAALEWSQRHGAAMTSIERAFLGASVERRDADAEAERRHLDDQRRANKRLRTQLVALAAVLALAIGAGVVAVGQRNSARDEAARADEQTSIARDEAARADSEAINANEQARIAQEEAARADDAAAKAVEQGGIARVRELAAESASVREDDPELAILLALAAVDAGGGEVRSEAERALHDAVMSTHVLERVEGGQDGVAAFFPGGDRFVTLNRDSSAAIVWGLDPLRQLHTLPAGAPQDQVSGIEDQIADAAVSTDGSRVATGGYNGNLRIWDADTGELEQELPLGVLGLVPVFSTDGAMVAMSGRSAGGRAVAKVWDVETGDELWTFDAPAGVVEMLNVEFSPDGSLLAVSANVVGVAPHGVRTWDLTTGEPARTYTGHDSFVRDMSFTPDGTRLVTASYDTTSKVFDVATGAVLATYSGHGGVLGDVEVSDDGQLVATAGSDVQVWALDTLQPLPVNVTHRSVDGLDFSPDGTRLLTSSHDDQTTRLWDLTSQRSHELLALPGPHITLEAASIAALAAPSQGVAFSADGRYLAAARDEGDITVWALPEGAEVATLEGPGDAIKGVDYSPDGDLLAAAGTEGVSVWSTADHSVVAELATDREVADIEFRSDGAAILTSGVDGVTEYALDDATANGRTSSELSDQPATGATYQPDRPRVVVTGNVNAPENNPYVDLHASDVGWWMRDVVDGEWFDTIWPQPFDVSFDPEGELLLVAGAGTRTGAGTVTLAASEDYSVVARHDGHLDAVVDAEFSPDGTEVATVSGDGTIQLWDPRTGITRLVLPATQMSDIAFSPDGRLLAAVGHDRVVVYLLDTGDLIDEARHRLTRTWTDGECAQYLTSEECPTEGFTAGLPLDRDDTTSGPEPAATPPPTAEATDTDPSADDPPVDADVAVELATRFVTALVDGDANAARGTLAQDAVVDVLGADASELEALLRFDEAVGHRSSLGGCEVSGGQVICRVEHANAWSEVLGAPPTVGTYTIDADGAGIEKVAYDYQTKFRRQDDGTVSGYIGVMFGFGDFVTERSASDGERMWYWDGNKAAPRLDDASIALYEQYTAEFVDAHST